MYGCVGCGAHSKNSTEHKVKFIYFEHRKKKVEEEKNERPNEMNAADLDGI